MLSALVLMFQDCLRTMVVALCDRKEYKTLVEYPYDDLQTDVSACVSSNKTFKCAVIFSTLAVSVA